MDAGLEFTNTASFQAIIKRAIDMIAAVAGLILLAPLFFLISVLIRIETPGKIIFYQERVGYGGRRFWMLKFRTMRVCAEQQLVDILSNDLDKRFEYERYQKLSQDPRLTRVGCFLRLYSLDELPQLWNVLKGEMSLVGPRPFLPEQLCLYGPSYVDYQQMVPGMTGLWQVSGRNHLSFTERVCLDRIYAREWSLWLDIKIIMMTPWAVLRQFGAY
jgi:lipopolysaccharide/colanic/teichoic acid biosynthesis glycosyltransferase